MAGEKFTNWERKTDQAFIHVNDVSQILAENQLMYTKQWIPIDKILERKQGIDERPYDLYYFMFHLF